MRKSLACSGKMACRVVLVAAGLFLTGGAARAQLTPPTNPRVPPPPPSFGMPDNGRAPSLPSGTREKMEQARNDDRQKRLVADTAKLQALANDLKADVDKTDKYTMSLDVLKRCEEIEKLARSIRDRMKE